jgi:SAM-dependent methyltransferase
LVKEGDFTYPVQSVNRLFSIWRCTDCWLSQLNQHLSEKERQALVGSTPEEQVSQKEIEAKIQANSFIVQLVQRFKQNGRALEIGAQSGYRSEALQRAGWRVTGIERRPEYVGFIHEHFDLDIHTDSMAAFVPDSPFDVAILWHSLHTLPSIQIALSHIAAFLAPGGYAFIQVPVYDNITSWRNHSQILNPLHNWYFTKPSLMRQLFQHNLVPIEVYENEYEHLTVVALKTNDMHGEMPSVETPAAPPQPAAPKQKQDHPVEQPSRLMALLPNLVEAKPEILKNSSNLPDWSRHLDMVF